MDYADVPGNLFLFLQLPTDSALLADKDNLQIGPEMSGLDPASDRISGSMVAPHGVNADAHRAERYFTFP
jgi:hypothetical protein